jgi:RNA polymerase sigma-70 factor (ECF subfamily)
MNDDRLAELYRAYGGAVYARCRRLLRDDHAAEDAAQETFIRVYRHLARAPDAREALRWIYRIATNYCLNELRDRRHRPEPFAHPPEPAQGTPAGDPLGDRDLVRRIVEKVPEKLRAVAFLHHVDGLEQAEVAAVLGISRRTVVSRLSEFGTRARALAAKAISGA